MGTARCPCLWGLTARWLAACWVTSRLKFTWMLIRMMRQRNQQGLVLYLLVLMIIQLMTTIMFQMLF